MNAHLIRTSRQWVEPSFEFGKSGIKADVLGYGSRLPSGMKDAHLHPAPRHGARLRVGAQWTARVEAVLRAGWLWGVIGAPGLRTRLSSVTIVPAVIFTTSSCISSWRPHSVPRAWPGSAASVAEMGEPAIFVHLESEAWTQRHETSAEGAL